MPLSARCRTIKHIQFITMKIKQLQKLIRDDRLHTLEAVKLDRSMFSLIEACSYEQNQWKYQNYSVQFFVVIYQRYLLKLSADGDIYVAEMSTIF